MQVTFKEESESKRVLTISGNEADLAKIKKHTLENLQPKIGAPGFREGKAPLGVVEKQLGAERVQAEVLEEAVNHMYSETIIERKIRPLDKPKIQIIKFVPFTEIEFKAEVEIVPPIKLTDYKAIKIKRQPAKVNDEDIRQVIDNLRERTAEKQEVKRAAQEGDEVILDFRGVKDGQEVAGASAKDHPLKLGSGSFIPGFEENLIGLKPGQEKTFKLKFPKEYGHKGLAGQEVEFSAKVKSINSVKLPEPDDQWAKLVGPFNNLQSLKDDIKAQLMQQKLQQADNQLKDAIVEKLLDKSDITVPEVLLKDQVEHLRGDFLNNLAYRGITLKEYLQQQGLSEEEWTKRELEPAAERRVKIGLVLSEVAEQEGLKVTEEELNLRVQLLKNQHQDEQAKAQFDKPEQRRDVASRLLTEKTLNKLAEYASS